MGELAALSRIAQRGRENAARGTRAASTEVANSIRRLARPLLRAEYIPAPLGVEGAREFFEDKIPGAYVGEEIQLRVASTDWCGPNAISVTIPHTSEGVCLPSHGPGLTPTGDIYFDGGGIVRDVFREAEPGELSPYLAGLEKLAEKRGIAPDERERVS